MATKSKAAFQVEGKNKSALFTMKLHRGDGMALIAMNWKKGKPPLDFVGFAIEYKEPGGNKYFVVNNRLAFPGKDGKVNATALSSRLSPIQKFRWVHFPRNAEMKGEFIYRVTPVFMNAKDELSYGEYQQAGIELRRETYPGQLNVSFTRGFVASQAFVDRFGAAKDAITTLLPPNSDDGLNFKPTHPDAKFALSWMGFEARSAVLEVLDKAIADKKAKVYVVAYDLSEPDVVGRLEKLGKRLQIIIDDDGSHAKPGSGENQSEQRLKKSAGIKNVKRQHMSGLQHNKTIVVDGPKTQLAVCGSTNYTWRGFFVQNNNAMILKGKKAVAPFLKAFQNYWDNETATTFGATESSKWQKLGLTGIDAQVGFSPFAKTNSVINSIGKDIAGTTSSLFFSLAFLAQTPGVVVESIKKVVNNKNRFAYGIADKEVGGLDLQKPDGNVAAVHPVALSENLPEPFKKEPTGGGGTRMHHKFVVIDFDKATARVYFGSYNFSAAADSKNGENVLLVRDQRIATSYMIEALRIFDHYHFRVAQSDAKTAQKELVLAKPPHKPKEKPWWDKDYTVKHKIKDRELFA